jgi:hypothetical protein
MSRARKAQRWLFASDLHCGHIGGLTPPDWRSPPAMLGGLAASWQADFWDWWTVSIRQHGPFDGAVWNGDLIDGLGRKSHGSEQITTDAKKQVSMAIACVQSACAPRNIITAGTAYHTGDDCDFEEGVAKEVRGGQFAPHVRLDVDGVRFNLRHHGNASSLPYGMSAGAKEAMWGLIQEATLAQHEGRAPHPADWYVRSHAHRLCLYETAHLHALAMPCLQLPVSKFGRRCSGAYDVGFCVATIQGGQCSWQVELMPIKHRGETLEVQA